MNSPTLATIVRHLLLPLAAAALFACGAVDPNSSENLTEENTIVPVPLSECTTAAECAHPNICALCVPGRGPACASAECFDGALCSVIEPCSGLACKTAADCPHPNICAACTKGHGPGCATSQCINGWCHEIDACSL
jgi:hypothetical protein